MISKSKKELALREYVSSLKPLAEVAKNHSMSVEVLRQYATEKKLIRKKGRVSNQTKSSAKASAMAKLGIVGRGIVLGSTVRKQKNNRPSNDLVNGFSRWSAKEDEAIMDAIINGTHRDTVAEMLGRSAIAISSRKYVLLTSGRFEEYKNKRFKPLRTKRGKRSTESKTVAQPVISTPKMTPFKTGLDFSALADLVKSHGIKVSISIDGSGAKINMEI